MDMAEVGRKLEELGQRKTKAADESAEQFRPPSTQPSPSQVREQVVTERATRRATGSLSKTEDVDADAARQRAISVAQEKQQEISKVRASDELTPEAKDARVRRLEAEYSQKAADAYAAAEASHQAKLDKLYRARHGGVGSYVYGENPGQRQTRLLEQQNARAEAERDLKSAKFGDPLRLLDHYERLGDRVKARYILDVGLEYIPKEDRQTCTVREAVALREPQDAREAREAAEAEQDEQRRFRIRVGLRQRAGL